MNRSLAGVTSPGSPKIFPKILSSEVADYAAGDVSGFGNITRSLGR
jgi:hypothetical protein